MFMQHHNDTINRQTHDDKVAGINNRRSDKDRRSNKRRTQKDAGRLLYRIFYLSLYL